MKARLVILALVTAALLTGCMRLHFSLDIASDDTASASIVMAVSDEVATALGYEDPADAWSDFEVAAMEEVPDTVTTEPYASGGFTGVLVTVPSTPIDSIDLAGAHTTVVRDGDTFVVTGGLNEEELGSAKASETAKPDIVYTVSFPGAVFEHNGTLVDSNTVQWTLESEHIVGIRAVGSAVVAEPEAIRGAADARVPAPELGGLLWIWVGALVVAIALAVVVIVVARKRRAGN